MGRVESSAATLVGGISVSGGRRHEWWQRQWQQAAGGNPGGSVSGGRLQREWRVLRASWAAV